MPGWQNLHILDEISMSRAINVGVVTVLCLVLDVGRSNGDTTSSLFGCLVNVGIVDELVVTVLFGHGLGDGGCEGSLSVINVAYVSARSLVHIAWQL